jgi:hypothetical protein
VDLPPSVTAKGFAALIALLIVGLFALSINRRGQVDPGTGALTMRYSLPLRVTGWVLGLVVPIGFVALLFVVPFQKPQDPWIAGGLLTFFTLGGAVILLETHRFRVTVTDEGIECLSPWRRRRFIAWGDVTRVTSSSNAAFFVIRGRDRTRITLPAYLAGLRELGERMIRRLDPAVYAEALRAFAQLGFPPLPLDRPGRRARYD